MEQYLKEFYDEEITNLLNDANDAVHVSINVSLTNLQRHQPHLFAAFLADPHTQLTRWNAALLAAQKQLLEHDTTYLSADYQIKEHCHVRFVQLPATHVRSHLRVFPNHEQVARFVQVKGNVVRMTQAKLLECAREYVCGKCGAERLVRAEYAKMYVIEAPRGCVASRESGGGGRGAEGDGGCRGTMYPKQAQPAAEHCVDFQEIRIQELISHKNIPASLIVTLDQDLVDSCQPGDCITVCGTMERRWRPLVPGKRSEVQLALRALSVYREEKRPVTARDLPEHLICVRVDWQELVDRVGERAIRDQLVRSFCPEVHGMYLVKLAILLALSSGGNPKGRDASGNAGGSGGTTRGNSHLILVGDPGLAKSRLLKFAAAVAVRAVHTTGMGCSAAGLTAAAVKEDGEWQLEAGALVLADGGVCCIDEFNLMRESDKASIHEAMEQQTISMAKAGLVCKLSTRCIVLAATNPKNLYAMYESDGMAAINIGIASPLLSRFDIVLIMRDERNPDWDNQVADHVLNHSTAATSAQKSQGVASDVWSIAKLQTHLMAIRDIHPSLSAQANLILGAYYKACRAHLRRDPARTSVRLLDSLVRLAQAHARLMFRNEVSELDAVLVVRLMESSWGFGALLTPQNILKAQLPIGPSTEQVEEVKAKLLLDYVSEEVTQHAKVTNEIVRTEVRSSSPKPLVSVVSRTVSEDIFEEPNQEEFSHMSLLTNRSFASVMRGNSPDSQSSSSTSQGSPSNEQPSQLSQRTGIAGNVQSLASLLADTPNDISQNCGTSTAIEQQSRRVFASDALDDDNIDEYLSLNDLPTTNVSSILHVKKNDTKPNEKEKLAPSCATQPNASTSSAAPPTQSIALSAIGNNISDWVQFEDDDEDENVIDAHHDDLTADLVMEFSQGFGDKLHGEHSEEPHYTIPGTPHLAQPVLSSTPQLAAVSDLPKFQFNKAMLSSKSSVCPPGNESKENHKSGAKKISMHIEVAAKKTKPNHSIDERTGNCRGIIESSDSKKMGTLQANIRTSSTVFSPVDQNPVKESNITVEKDIPMHSVAESKPRRVVSAKTLNRLNMFCKPREAVSAAQVPADTGPAVSSLSTSSDSAYESMVLSADQSTVSTTTPISQPKGRTSVIFRGDDTEDLSFLDHLDM